MILTAYIVAAVAAYIVAWPRILRVYANGDTGTGWMLASIGAATFYSLFVAAFWPIAITFVALLPIARRIVTKDRP